VTKRTLTFASSTTLEKGERISIMGERFVVTSRVNPCAVGVRLARWYERAWWWLRDRLW